MLAAAPTPPAPEAQRREPLTDEQIDQLDWHLSAERDYEPHSGQERLVVAGNRDFARAIERTCAEAWGVKLGATTGEQR